jgi:hypothetical protein
MVRTNDHAWELPFRLSTAPDTFAVDTVFRIYRYLFAWADDPRVEEVLTEALQPEARLLGREGNWLLYESTLPVLPLPTPDSLLPSPHGPHLDQRLRAVIAKLPHETRWPVARRLGLETIDATEPTKL